MRIVPLATCLAAALSTTACASMGGESDGPPGEPDLARSAGEPAPPQAAFYADCIAAAAATKSYVKEPGENFLRFTCTGRVARAFYDALGPWSASQGSEYVVAGRTERFGQRLVENTVGIDSCSTDGTGDYRCTVVLNVGEFLSAD
ncbi:hypothetical protein KOAAANKH_02290 [Brevundimonas sp. NIBR10]|uniref:hypothetical protein n=1 Tax=Brevundimonas sp. NIBR10 TaxID=3015997 RepID=UPI0022F1BB74|nr:hypothetical protein [Brevundimonas sp. NIBR10]WGM47413.1 hypothetical protein KOAAANKH_02290 [Brevundimonas sp. NIBR10]